MYEIIIEPPAERFIKSLKKDEQKKLFDRIEELSNNPRLGKELVGKLSGLRSLRVGSYRVVYKVEEMKLVVLVLRAGHRKDIYSKKIGK
jgi:mRNA interferase RelE/StbE